MSAGVVPPKSPFAIEVDRQFRINMYETSQSKTYPTIGKKRGKEGRALMIPPEMRIERVEILGNPPDDLVCRPDTIQYAQGVG